METPNLTYIKELSDNDVLFEKKMIDVIKTCLKEEYALFNKHFEKKNYIEASNNVHKIKHQIGVLGMPKSFEMATAFEDDLKNNSIKLFYEFDQLIKTINAFLNNNYSSQKT